MAAADRTPPHLPHTSLPTPACAGRVKTLHPGVHGGILARRDLPAHMAAIGEHSIQPIDIVIVNLYPFRQTVTAATKPSYEVGAGGRQRCLLIDGSTACCPCSAASELFSGEAPAGVGAR